MTLDYIKDIVSDATIYEDVTLRKYEIPLIAVALNGAYVILDTTDENIINLVSDAMLHDIGIRQNQLFLFGANDLFGDDFAGVFCSYTSGIIQFDDIVPAFENCYQNHLLPQVVLQRADISAPEDYCYDVKIDIPEAEIDELYVAPVLSIADINRYITKLESISATPDASDKYRVTADGELEIKRDVQERVGPVKLFISGHSAYFPCMELDGDTFFKLALFGGIIGLHHYKTGHILKGIFYTLTFGCCGVFYILDLVQILTGTFNYKSTVPGADGQYQRVRYFSRPVSNKKFAIPAIFAAIIFAFAAVYFCYIPLMQFITASVSDLLAQTQWAKNAGAQMGLTE